jgi:hypothetical protein
MTSDEIRAAIDDRLKLRWHKRLLDENAAPVCCIGIKQLQGPDWGVPVLCTLEEMPIDQLADLLLGISRFLRGTS